MELQYANYLVFFFFTGYQKFSKADALSSFRKSVLWFEKNKIDIEAIFSS